MIGGESSLWKHFWDIFGREENDFCLMQFGNVEEIHCG